MKFNVSSTELLKGLMDISKAIPAKSALPILENFLFYLFTILPFYFSLCITLPLA